MGTRFISNKNRLSMYFVYVLKSISHSKTYVGFTNDINRRLKEHNSGKSKFTSKFAPWEIIYKEEYSSQEDAIKREKYLKSATGRRFLKEIIDN